MNGIKLYIPFKELNIYIRNCVDKAYKDHTFVPVKVEINEMDWSIEICMVTTTPLEGDGVRYKLDLKEMEKEIIKNEQRSNK